MKQKNEEYHIINDIKCKIVYEKIKNTYIQIKDGEVIIKTSLHSSIKYVEDVVNSKADWINKKLQEQLRKINTTYKDGSTVRVLGKPYTLKIKNSGNKYLIKLNKFLEFQKIKKIKDNSVLFVPHPIYINKRFYIDILKKTKEKKNIKLIFLIHDLDSLRKMFPESEKEFKHIDETMYKIADYIIAHNSLMKNYLVNQGINDKKIYELGIFDYLTENNLAEKEIKYSKTLNIAGNLDTNKCKYIKGLNTLDKSVKVNLYGLNFNKDILNSESISYKGAFPADEIPSKLNEGFGLVWDGDGIDGCTGNTGNYLRYNNPHKLSLYLVSGLPVVIWSEAAEAQFVKDNNVGIIVDSIDDFSKKFDELSEQQYYEMVENAKKISGKLRNGEYLSRQISQIRDDIEKAEI